MSVVFTSAPRSAGAHVVTCGCSGATARAPRYGAWEDADAEAGRADTTGDRAPLPGCEMPDICPLYPLHAEQIDSDGTVPAVDTHNGTARLLLPLLGLSGHDDLSPGSLPAGDFLGRVLTALALSLPDPGAAGRPGRFATGSRPPGHLRRRLLDLHDLAQWCELNGRPVTWS
ncbi:hypothetical protein ACIOG4_27700 [Streptomyces microflavus]|uniref:hypothetical protein n=1 Tax=Streptomyces microflavus TaxID=1919 RepID=UPI0037F285AC